MRRGRGANRFTFDSKLAGRGLGARTYELIGTPAGGKPRKVVFKIAP